MLIKLAEVKDNTDLSRRGVFRVQEESYAGTIPVKYVTPYWASFNGGFVAIPEVGSLVLICQPENDLGWYYLGSVYNTRRASALAEEGDLIKERDILPDAQIYKARGIPQRQTFLSPRKNGLILSDEYNPDYFNIKTTLRSSTGKRFELIDSPLIDAIIMRNEHHDHIKISTTANGSHAARTIEAETQGPVRVISRESSIDVHVEDGKEINITNHSTGAKRISEEDSTPGNINIYSRNRDINLTVDADDGVIYLQSTGQNSHIVLVSEGTIDIQGKKGVNITSQNGDVTVQGQTINLNP